MYFSRLETFLGRGATEMYIYLLTYCHSSVANSSRCVTVSNKLSFLLNWPTVFVRCFLEVSMRSLLLGTSGISHVRGTGRQHQE